MEEQKRNSGFEAMRILSMVMIVLMHGIGHGGLGSAAPQGTAAFWIYWLLFILARVSTNCFVMLSGYYLSERKGPVHAGRLFRIGAQVWFYSMLTFCVAVKAGAVPLSAVALLRALLPLTSNGYWFASAYFLMYLSVPVLNAVVQSLDRRQYKTLLLVALLLQSVWGTLFYWATDATFVNNGYSFIWFYTLYFMAAYFRKYRVTVPSGLCLLAYLAASAAMDMFVATDALDAVRFSSLKADGWYIEEAKKAMEDGDIIYAGKYSAPDYEMILNENCGLAIENTMILHTPEVKEQLEKFNIPVMVDHSSYETNPLGRTEWVKLYGLLTGHEEQAEQVFDSEAKAFEQVSNQDATGKTVAFFYITTNGEANVRKSADYLPKMIELAGGSYIFDDLGDEEDATSTVSLQMEEFYAGAKDADYIIYNSTIEGELSSMQDLLAKSPLLEKFKAVKEGHVYCTTKNLYQSTMELGTITSDIRKMLTGDDADLTYLYKVE